MKTYADCEVAFEMQEVALKHLQDSTVVVNRLKRVNVDADFAPGRE